MTLFPSGWSSGVGAGEQVCRVIIRPGLAGSDMNKEDQRL